MKKYIYTMLYQGGRYSPAKKDWQKTGAQSFTKMRADLEKKPRQQVTIAECAGYFEILYEAVEEAVLFNDLPDEEEEDYEVFSTQFCNFGKISRIE